MSRTTINIDPTVLRQVKRLASSQRKTLTQVVSELLVDALAKQDKDVPEARLSWKAKSMRARIDLANKDAIYEVLDGR